MSNVTITPVRTRREKTRFLNVPWQLNREDPNWVPPLRTNQKELVGYKRHPFYDNAEIQTFLAVRDGRLCGRIGAVVNHAHNRRFQDEVGFFGFFESIDDQQVANALFDAAGQWLKERGKTTIRGPMSPSYNHDIGLLVDGFDSPPTFMMTYNPRYYENLVENYGFTKEHDLYAYYGHVDQLENQDKKIGFIIEESTRRFDFKLRRMDMANFDQEVRTFLKIYNEAHGSHWGFIPLSESEIKHMSKSMRFLMTPELTTVAEVDGRVVGTAFGMLDYNPRIKQIDGRLFPFGFLRLMLNRKKIKRMRVIAAHVLPEYQRWGLGVVLLSRLTPEVLNWGIKEAEFSWIAESNHLSRASLERGDAKRDKTYRIYDCQIK